MNIPQQAEKTAFPPPISEPEEFDPVQLYWLVISELEKYKIKWNLEDYAEVFGWTRHTIYKWVINKYPAPRQARIRAATLKKEWGL